MERLWDYTTGDVLIRDAARLMDIIAKSNFHRDNIRTEPFTQGLIKQIRDAKKAAAATGAAFQGESESS